MNKNNSTGNHLTEKVPIKHFLLIMRATLILLFVCVFCSMADVGYTQNARVTINKRNTSLREVLNEIEKQTDYLFIYNNEVNTNEKVSVRVKGKAVSEVLNSLLDNKDIEYSMEGNHILLSIANNFEEVSIEDRAASIQQQKKQISGTVEDEYGYPVIGANIIEVGTTNGTVTDVDGKFTLSVEDDAIIRVTYIGYHEQEVNSDNQQVLNITLIEDTQSLEEVVVVGYGTQKKINLTGSVQNVTNEEITRRNASNISNALQGLIPGVSVTQASGRPGADAASIRIRGIGSINSSTSPLILIDGVEGDINNIDPNTIESISVLKDAASASIYGSRASNGVILLTTKRGVTNDLRVSYSGYMGYNSPTEMPTPVSAIDYMMAINEARANADMDPQYSESLINDYRTLGADNFTRFDTDWVGAVIKDKALTHNNSLTVSGGSDRIKFFGNFGYYYQDGIIANNDYNRMTLRINTDINLTDWLMFGGDINIRESTSVRPSGHTAESIIQYTTIFPSVFSGLNDDGTWGYGQNGLNPIAVAEASGLNTATTPDLGIKGFITITPLDGLNITSSYSKRKLDTKSDYFLKPYDTYESGDYKTTYPSDGTTKYEGWSQVITNQFNLQSNFERSFNDHYLNLLAGMQTEEKLGSSFLARRKGFEYDGFEDLDHGDVATATNAGNHWEWAMLSYYSRINYNYRQKYLLELNGRWDASSRFIKENRWGFFPSASAAWRISEENFFTPIKNSINDLKFRISYGTLGNQEIFSYTPYAATISPGYGYWFDKELGTGVAQTQVANEAVTWEKSSQLNFGVDANLFTKLNLSFDYYIRDVDNMLQQFPIPLYVGFSSPWENAGSMRNNGWDLTLSWRDRIGNLKYHITGNLSDVKNTVTNLYGNEYVGTQITREGDPINSWYGYVSDGYFQSQSEIDNSPVYGAKQNVKPGHIRFKDISGPDGKPDGIINDFDRDIIGDPSPRYEYSINLGGDWKEFDFSLFLQGLAKRDVFYSGGGARPFWIGGAIFEHQLDYWTEDNRDADFPLLLIDGHGVVANNMISDFWVKSGAYMRLKNLVIGYSLPQNLTNSLKLEKIRFYANGQNLFTWSKSDTYKGYDPEVSVSGGSFYPVMRTFTFGVEIDF